VPIWRQLGTRRVQGRGNEPRRVRALVLHLAGEGLLQAALPGQARRSSPAIQAHKPVKLLQDGLRIDTVSLPEERVFVQQLAVG
jgi:hypothetical protein